MLYFCFFYKQKNRFAANKSFLFGGYNTAYLDEIFYSNQFPLLTEPTINETKWAFTTDTYENGVTYTVDSNTFFERWTMSDTTMPSVNYLQYRVYNNRSRYPECVWLIGGVNCQTCVYCFNLTTEEFIVWDTVTNGDYPLSDGTSVLFSEDDADYIYYAERTGNIIKYNIANKSEVIWYDYNEKLAFTYQCLAKHPWSNQWLFVLTLAEAFWIYDFKTGFWTQGPSLTYGRTYAGCIVHQNTGEDPYFYVIGGNSEYIEKINLNNFTNFGSGWETVGGSGVAILDAITDASTNFAQAEYFSVFSYDDLIYIVGGYDTTYENDIVYLNTTAETVTWDGDILLSQYGSMGMYVFIFWFFFVFWVGCFAWSHAHLVVFQRQSHLTRTLTVMEIFFLTFQRKM